MNNDKEGTVQHWKSILMNKIEELSGTVIGSKEISQELKVEILNPLIEARNKCVQIDLRQEDHLDLLRGQWTTVYAQYGSGVIPTKLRYISFGSLKGDTNISLVESNQEIEPEEKSYNNVLIVESSATDTTSKKAYCIIYGRYVVEQTIDIKQGDDEDDDDSDETNEEKERRTGPYQGLNVSFYRVELRPMVTPENDEEWMVFRKAFGLKEDEPLSVDLHPSKKQQTDAVFLDVDTRVMYGLSGGVYVMKKSLSQTTNHEGVSTTFK